MGLYHQTGCRPQITPALLSSSQYISVHLSVSSLSRSCFYPSLLPTLLSLSFPFLTNNPCFCSPLLHTAYKHLARWKALNLKPETYISQKITLLQPTLAHFSAAMLIRHCLFKHLLMPITGEWKGTA